jgi:prepilin-type N-terminal cleavage/methylation domain-containing protein
MKRRNYKGFTLIECIIGLAVFAIVISLVLNVYAFGFRMYLLSETEVELEQNIRIAAGRIMNQIRALDNPSSDVLIRNNQLRVGPYRYYIDHDSLLEYKDSRANELAVYIERFEPSISDDMITLTIEARKNTNSKPVSVNVALYIGSQY